MEDYLLPCINKSILGFDCPGCGIQRACLLILKGEFYKAFLMYPAIYTLLLFFSTTLFHLIDKKRNYLKPIKYLAILNGIIISSTYIYKILTI